MVPLLGGVNSEEGPPWQPERDSLYVLIARLGQIVADIDEGRIGRGASRLYKDRWVEKRDLADLSPTVVDELKRHSAAARVALLKYPANVEKAKLELTAIRDLLELQ
jgi:hypothetical protein